MKEIKCRDLLSNEIECRVGTVKEGKGFSLLLYKTARADMTLLDETYGVNNWQCRYYQVKNTMICAISIWDEEKKCWIEKCDGGDDDFNAEKIKGECSDAFKRAGFRVLPSTRKLYNSPFIWVNEDKENNKYTKYEVSKIAYDDTSVTELVIINPKTKQVVYSYGIKGNQASKEPKDTKESHSQFDNKHNVTMKELNASVVDMGDYQDPFADNEDMTYVKEYYNSLEESRKEKFSIWLFTTVQETKVEMLNEQKAKIVADLLRKQVAKELEKKASDK